MSTESVCPKCQSENIYQDGNLWVCPECANEWTAFSSQSVVTTPADDGSIRDAFGNILANGDTITILKDLKIKGSNSAIKGGTKVKNIRLSDAGDGHNLSGKIEGFGVMNLKSEFVKKI